MPVEGMAPRIFYLEKTMIPNLKIQEALLHVNARYPEITQVFYGVDGRWLFCDPTFSTPKLRESLSGVDFSLLEKAEVAAELQAGFPCGFTLQTVEDMYDLWEGLLVTPVTGTAAEPEKAAIAEEFFHFPKGTLFQEIKEWFQAMHPMFQPEFASNVFGCNVARAPVVDVLLPENPSAWSKWNICQGLTDRWGELNYHNSHRKPLKELEENNVLLERLRAQMWDEITFIVQKDAKFGILFEVEYYSRESEGLIDPVGCAKLDFHHQVVERIMNTLVKLEEQFPGVEFAVPDEQEIPEERPAAWAFVSDGLLSEDRLAELGRALLDIR